MVMGKDYRTDPRGLVDFLRGRLRGGPILDVPSLEAGQLLDSVVDLIESLAVQPILLSERKPEAQDLLNRGPCSVVWLGRETPGGYWSWELTDVCFAPDYTHWLPASTRYLPARVEG